MSTDSADPGRDQEAQSIPIDVPEELALGVYANFAVIVHSPWDFVLTFCRLIPPTGEEQSIRAKAVARVIIPATIMGTLIDAMKRNQEQLTSLRGEKMEE